MTWRALHKGHVKMKLEKWYDDLHDTIQRLDIAQPDLRVKLIALRAHILKILSEPPL